MGGWVCGFIVFGSRHFGLYQTVPLYRTKHVHYSPYIYSISKRWAESLQSQRLKIAHQRAMLTKLISDPET